MSLDRNRVKHFRGYDSNQEIYVNDKNEMSITFVTSSSKTSSYGKNFELILTAFSMANSSGQCLDQWFNCGDNRCLRKGLMCDNVSNCVTGEDESQSLCDQWFAKNKQLFWTLFVIGWAISTFFIVLTVIVCLIYRRLCFVICFWIKCSDRCHRITFVIQSKSSEVIADSKNWDFNTKHLMIEQNN